MEGPGLSRGPGAEAEIPGAWETSQMRRMDQTSKAFLVHSLIHSFIHSFIRVRSFESHRGCREGEKSDEIILQIIGGELMLRKGQPSNFTVGKRRPRAGRDFPQVIQWPRDCLSHPKLWEEDFGGI